MGGERETFPSLRDLLSILKTEALGDRRVSYSHKQELYTHEMTFYSGEKIAKILQRDLERSESYAD